MRSISLWLSSVGLAQYADVFEDNDVDVEALWLLNENDLQDLGVMLGRTNCIGWKNGDLLC